MAADDGLEPEMVEGCPVASDRKALIVFVLFTVLVLVLTVAWTVRGGNLNILHQFNGVSTYEYTCSVRW